MQRSWRRTRSLTWKPTTEIDISTPRLATSAAALHGSGGAQLSPPSVTSTTLRRPSAEPRSPGTASSELPIGVRPLPVSPSTVERSASLSSGPTGTVSSVSLQPSARETSLTLDPYTRSPSGAFSGRRSTSAPTACLAASRRVPPLPASSFIDFDASSTISARLRVSDVCARAVGAGTSSSATARPRRNTSRRLPLVGDVTDDLRELVADLLAGPGPQQRGDDRGDEEQQPEVLGGRLPTHIQRSHADRDEEHDPAPMHGSKLRPPSGPRQGPRTQSPMGRRSQTRVGPAGLPAGPGH